jgi:hypothetical protein
LALLRFNGIENLLSACDWFLVFEFVGYNSNSIILEPSNFLLPQRFKEDQRVVSFRLIC